MTGLGGASGQFRPHVLWKFDVHPGHNALMEFTNAISARQVQLRFMLLLIWLAWGVNNVHAVPAAVNVAVVVNSSSPASLAVANEYIAARKIPAGNVIFIDLPSKYVEAIDVNDFRKLLLEPVCDTLRQRKLNGQIDVVAWSADFPHAVRVGADIGNDKPPKIFTPVASINGLTYLYGLTLAKDPAYLALTANRYAPPVHRVKNGEEIRFVPPRAFHRSTGWENDGSPIVNQPDKGYLLSTVLGITAGRGNTVEEVREMIRRSAAADGTAPKGTVYYMVNGDIRAKTRQWGFKLAADRLKELGVGVEVLDGVLPKEKDDVAGAMVGIAGFNWTESKSKMLPGAIAEHLTSTGGVMFKNAGQTPISEFIRAGASGTSGTVTEPYAIQEKFPSPFIQVYYASGCSLAEAFYQSVSGPYQLLIIGDPLCRPWGKVPKIKLNVAAETALKGQVTIAPTCASEQMTVARYELYLDGKWLASEQAGKALPLDTTAHADGWHELRVVGVLGDAIESKGEAVVPVRIANQGLEVKVTLAEQKVKASLAGAKRLVLLHQGRELAQVEGSAGTFELDRARLGEGPAPIQVAGEVEGRMVMSKELMLHTGD